MKSHISLSNILQAEVYKTLRNRRIVTLLLSPLVFYLLILLYAIYKGRTGLLDATAFAYDGNPRATTSHRGPILYGMRVGVSKR